MANLKLTAAACLGLAAGACASASGAGETSAAATHPAEGAWSLMKVEAVGPDGAVTVDPAMPGVFHLQNGRYALIWTPTRSPREPFAVLAEPTDEETIRAFQTIVFNAGSATFIDEQLVTTAEIARVPGFEGGRQFYNVDVAGDVLTLEFVDEIYPSGERPSWIGERRTIFTFERAGEGVALD